MAFRFFTSGGTSKEKKTNTALMIFRTLSVRPFSYPFSSPVKVREAVTMELRSMVGDGALTFAAVPFFISREKNRSSGSSFIVSEEEIIKCERELPDGTAMIPAPMAFVSEVQGNGLIVCIKNGLSGIYFKDNVIEAARWMSEGTSPESMILWFKEYARSQGNEISKVSVKHMDSLTEDEVKTSLSESEKLYSQLEDFSISVSAAKNSARKDALMTYALAISKTLMITGAIFIFCSLALLMQCLNSKDTFTSLPSAVYIKAFGEPSSAPLRTALKKAREIVDSGPSLNFKQLVGDISSAAGQNGLSSVHLDSLRYGRERSEIQGETEDAHTAELFRDGLTALGYEAKITDIRQIPGSGMRFAISLERRKTR